MSKDSETILGFDYGLKRIGVAVGVSLTGQAAPLCTVKVRRQKPDWEKISELVTEWNPDRFVVGLSMHADHTESPVSSATKHFAASLEKRFKRTADFVDEYLSSYTAAFHTTKHGLDAEAARVILETWLTENIRKNNDENKQ